MRTNTSFDKEKIRKELQARNDRAREAFKQRMIRLFGDFYKDSKIKDRTWAD